MSRRTLAILVAVAVAALVVGAVAWGIGAVERHIADSLLVLEARRPYAPKQDFLTEEEALAIARSAMDAAGYPSDAWLPFEDGRGTAPDGRKDIYLSRNAYSPHRGSIMFRNAERNDPYRTLYVVMGRQDDGRLRVIVTRGK